MNNQDHNQTGLQADVSFVAFLTLLSLMVILVSVTPAFTWSIAYTAVTVVVVLITYFNGIMAGLLSNLAFIFLQIAVTAYFNFKLHQVVPTKMMLWLILPGLLSIAVAMMVNRQQRLRAYNRFLRAQLTERGTFDSQTHLRTIVAFMTDARVYVANHRQYDLPVAMIVLRIRYYPELKRLMSSQQQQTLIRVITTSLTAVAQDNDLTYFLDAHHPTWGMLLHADKNRAQQLVLKIKAAVNAQLQQNESMQSLDVSLIAGVIDWDATLMHSPHDLLQSGIRETEYDV
ncbi:hypothetical protein [Secundilactobacillus odoratitofui]|uniref:hypothetical protein n=1 Tax=Secundilactobacillus odoratitofui TaxID=480930 RepID=UPI0006CF83A4|nr:hypothetical protein [Secundilactobacillus odoratitofui]